MSKVSDVASMLNINIETIRYYEKQGLLPEFTRSASGYRVFSKEHIIRLRFILEAKDFGFLLKEIKDLIDSGIADFITRREETQTITSEMNDELDLLLEKKIAEVENEIDRLSMVKSRLVEYKQNESYKKLKQYDNCKLNQMLDSVP